MRQIIEDGIAEAERVRAPIRLPLGSRTRMVLSVTDTDGEVLGLYRMPDATVFSIDVAVAKARNVAYYADPAELQPEDQVDDDSDGDADVPAGTAFTNRTFRYLASPFFPTGVDTARLAAPFSILNDPGINPQDGRESRRAAGRPIAYRACSATTRSIRARTSASWTIPTRSSATRTASYSSPAARRCTRMAYLVGGFGVSGDGVDQDDVVTFGGSGEFLPRAGSAILRADETFVRGVRLPYQKFSRNPRVT